MTYGQINVKHLSLTHSPTHSLTHSFGEKPAHYLDYKCYHLKLEAAGGSSHMLLAPEIYFSPKWEELIFLLNLTDWQSI
jgi:hypothetical protein